MSDELDQVISDGVATITLNRPAALNALTVAMKVGLREALDSAAEDDQVRAVVITGAGRGFCVGQDLNEHLEQISSGDTASTVAEHYNPLIEAIVGLPKPVIAAVNGPAAGAGAAIAYACDLRIAADTASFMMAFSRIGLGPDSGASWTLQRLVGYGRAMTMMMLAETVAAPQALEMGIVSAVVPGADLAAVAGELAAKLAAGPTFAYGVIKKSQLYAASHSLSETLALEGVLQAECAVTVDHHEAVKAFLAKQPATFIGR